ncbi:hypothetical protein SVIOM74S_04543 [Streptomyces violarus]
MPSCTPTTDRKPECLPCAGSGLDHMAWIECPARAMSVPMGDGAVPDARMRRHDGWAACSHDTGRGVRGRLCRARRHGTRHDVRRPRAPRDAPGRLGRDERGGLVPGGPRARTPAGRRRRRGRPDGPALGVLARTGGAAAVPAHGLHGPRGRRYGIHGARHGEHGFHVCVRALGSRGHTPGGGSSLGMLAAHLLAALLCGLWLGHGERAVFRSCVPWAAGWPRRCGSCSPCPHRRPRPCAHGGGPRTGRRASSFSFTRSPREDHP